MASSRPSTVGGEKISRRSSGIRRGVVVLAAMAAVVCLPSVALGASEPTSGYKETPTVSKTTPTTGVSPAKEEAPAKEPAPTPTTSEKATTLPFTGFDLRWDLGLGVLLIVAGVSIVVVQRRQRRDSRR